MILPKPFSLPVSPSSPVDCPSASAKEHFVSPARLSSSSQRKHLRPYRQDRTRARLGGKVDAFECPIARSVQQSLSLCISGISGGGESRSRHTEEGPEGYVTDRHSDELRVFNV